VIARRTGGDVTVEADAHDVVVEGVESVLAAGVAPEESGVVSEVSLEVGGGGGGAITMVGVVMGFTVDPAESFEVLVLDDFTLLFVNVIDLICEAEGV